MGNVSNAERYSHINDVEKAATARYGTIEKSNDQLHIMHDRASLTRLFHEQTGVISTSAEEKASTGLLSAAATTTAREIENAIAQGNINNDLGERTGTQVKKIGYKVGKYAGKGLYVAGRGSLRYGKKGTELYKKGKSKTEAAKVFAVDVKKSIKDASKGAGSIILQESANSVANFKGSDDLGIKAITKPKDFLFKTARTLKVTKGAFSTAQKGAIKLKNSAEKVAEAGRAMVAVAKKAVANPVILQGIGIMVLIAIICSVVGALASSVGSIFSVFSLKSEDWEITQAYKYITKLDTNMLSDILQEKDKIHSPFINEYRYFINGVQVSREQMDVYTDADLIMAYLDSKYDSYSFSGFIAGIFGTTVKGELEYIHSNLHQWETSTGTYDVLHITTSGGVTSEWTETLNYMNINLTTQSWENYVYENKADLFEQDELERYEALVEVGVYAFREELGSPFVGINWHDKLSSRWGWRIHPISNEVKEHLGLDIAMSGGTPVNACNNGTVETGSDPDGLGNYIKIISAGGDYTVYGHLSSFAVSDGDTVNKGDVIGYVGSTGASTGKHLHLEYHKDGHSLNPLIFTRCES